MSDHFRGRLRHTVPCCLRECQRQTHAASLIWLTHDLSVMLPICPPHERELRLGTGELIRERLPESTAEDRIPA